MKNITDKQLIRALLVGFVLLAAGELYLIAVVSAHSIGNPAASSGDLSSAAVQSSGTTTSTPMITSVIHAEGGVVISIGSNSFTIKQSPSAAATTITISSNTQIVTQGAFKDQATQDADLAKFHAYVVSLEQDPQKNQYTLARLIAPAPYLTNSIQLADMKAGDAVYALGEQASDGSFAATQVTDTPASSAQQ
jgi:hypothetical protein